MVTAGDFKKGLTVEWDGGVWTIVDFQHVKPGKGAAFVRTKIKNIMTGAVAGAQLQPHRQDAQGHHRDQGIWNTCTATAICIYFMDTETYEPDAPDPRAGRGCHRPT